MLYHKIKTGFKTVELSPKIECMEQPQPVTFVTGFWNFIAMFQVTPYKFQWSTFDNKFSLSSSSFRKITCGTVHCCLILITQLWLCFRIGNLSRMEPVGSKLANLFQLIKTLSSGLKSVLFVRILWTRQEFLLDFVNRTFCNFKLTTSYWKISLLIGYMIITCASSLSPGNENEFIDKLLSLTSTSSVRADWWFEPFRVFVGFSTFCNCFWLSAANIIFLSIVLTLHSVAHKFELILIRQQIHSRNFIEMGLSTYDDVKYTVNNVNDFMGDLVFAFYLETLTYFAETTGVLAAEPQYLETVIFIVFLALFVYIWFLACEFHRKVNDITVKWIANCQAGQNISMDQRLRLNALSNENRDAQLGISCRFFTVTYSFIGSMLGLIITYGIIVLQTRT